MCNLHIKWIATSVSSRMNLPTILACNRPPFASFDPEHGKANTKSNVRTECSLKFCLYYLWVCKSILMASIKCFLLWVLMYWILILNKTISVSLQISVIYQKKEEIEEYLPGNFYPRNLSPTPRMILHKKRCLNYSWKKQGLYHHHHLLLLLLVVLYHYRALRRHHLLWNLTSWRNFCSPLIRYRTAHQVIKVNALALVKTLN